MTDTEWISRRAARAHELMMDMEVAAQYISHSPEAYRLETGVEAPHGLADRVMLALWEIEQPPPGGVPPCDTCC